MPTMQRAARIIKTTAKAWGLRLPLPDLLCPACSRCATKQETPRRAAGSNCAFQGQSTTGADFGSCEGNTKEAQGLTIFNHTARVAPEKSAQHRPADVFFMLER